MNADAQERPFDLSAIITSLAGEQVEVNAMVEQTENKQVRLLLFGLTGAGKTTLGNHLIGRELRIMEKDDGVLQIIGGKGIGEGFAAETTLPNFFMDENLAVIDCPGTRDVRGPEQQVKNAFYIQTIFNGLQGNHRLTNFTFLLVVRDNDLTIRGTGLRDSMYDLINLIGDFSENMRGRILLVPTGCPRTKEQVMNGLTALYASALDANHQSNIRENACFLSILKDIIDTKSIILFPKPTSRQIDQIYAPTTHHDILNWANRPSIQQLDASIVLDDKARRGMMEFANTLQKSLETRLVDHIMLLQKKHEDYSATFLPQPNDNNVLAGNMCTTHLENADILAKTLYSLDETIRNIQHRKSRLRQAEPNEIFEMDRGVVNSVFPISNGLAFLKPETSVYQTQQDKVIADVRQLQNCVEIEKKISAFDKLTYDSLLNAIHEFSDRIISRKKQLVSYLLIFYNKAGDRIFEQINTEASIILGKSHRQFDQTVTDYNGFRSFKREVDSLLRSSDFPGEKCKNFLILVRDNLLSQFQEVLDSDKNRIGDLSSLYMENITKTQHLLAGQYSTLITTDMPHGGYLTGFLRNIQELIDIFVKRLQAFVSENMRDINTEIRSLSVSITQSYDEYLSTRDSEIPSVMPRLQTFLDFFLDFKHKDKTAKKFKDSLIAALQGIEGSIQSRKINAYPGLTSFGKVLMLLAGLGETFFGHEIVRKITACQSCVNNSFGPMIRLVSLEEIEDAVINIPDIDDSFKLLLNSSCQRVYDSLNTRYVEHLKATLREKDAEFNSHMPESNDAGEVLWKQTLADIINKNCLGSSSTPEVINRLLSSTDENESLSRETNWVEARQWIQGYKQFYQLAENYSYAPRITGYQFISHLTDYVHSLMQNIFNAAERKKNAILFLLNGSNGKGGFWREVIDIAAQTNPTGVHYLLHSLQSIINGRHHQQGSLSGVLDIFTQHLNQCSTRLKISLTTLEQASDLYEGLKTFTERNDSVIQKYNEGKNHIRYCAVIMDNFYANAQSRESSYAPSCPSRCLPLVCRHGLFGAPVLENIRDIPSRPSSS